jgi:pyridoxal phosphate enzyme (YggS family)
MLKQNLEKVFEDIKNGNNLGERITLVGATKTICPEIINQSIELGVKVVAENKVSEFREKNQSIIGASQHFIGHLQTNKVKYLVGKVDLIHSVDSIHLAKAISDQASKKGVTQDILVQINIGLEEQKSGFTPEQTFDAVKEISSMPCIRIRGLMAMLPLTDDKLLLKNLCLQMRDKFDKIKSQYKNIDFLSVGMSADYKIAIQNGSNMIRLGSTIYGKRNYGGTN